MPFSRSEILAKLVEVAGLNFIDNDEKLLRYLDKEFYEDISPIFHDVRKALQKYPGQIVDLGAGRNPLRMLGLMQLSHITAVDPAYQWYEYHSSDPFAPPPYPPGVYGGVFAKEKLMSNVHSALKKVSVPGKIQGATPMIISGYRHREKVDVTLVPTSAVDWLNTQRDGSIQAISLFRVFPDEAHWRLVISKLASGGLLVTTGEGKSQFSNKSLFRTYHQGSNFSGGADVMNTALPADGSWADFGIQPLFPQLKVPYLYTKV